ncbi:MAG: hypothetical protein U0Q18_31745 [Bryobacteraceae bacterium]
MQHLRAGIAALACLLASSTGKAAEYLDLAPFGRTSTSVTGGTHATVVEWDDERDVREIRVRYKSAPPKSSKIEYWFRNWPYPAPRMPSMEDPVDDAWQGKWLVAESTAACQASECSYTFQPITISENALAKNLAGTRYRRTLKIRLSSAMDAAEVASVQVFSETTQTPQIVRVELGRGESDAIWTGSVAVFNGGLRSAQPWGFQSGDRFESPAHWSFRATGRPKGLTLDLIAADPAPPGSQDVTIVTIKARVAGTQNESVRTFSFSTVDLKRGPIEIPADHAYVSDPQSRTTARQPTHPRIRLMIPNEPEQTYERAAREIPELDPWRREGPDRVYLPLAADSSWQKFAFEYGGNVFISKRGTKAKGRELARLQWEGDRMLWKIGTGETPYYRDDRQCSVSKLEGYLPVITQRWKNEGLDFTEEAFATLLSGELSPESSGRNEETPGILMLRLSAHNSDTKERLAHIWLSQDPGEQLAVTGNRVQAVGNKSGPYSKIRLRAIANAAGGRWVETHGDAVHLTFPVPAGQSKNLFLKLPFVSDLDTRQAADLDVLEYGSQRSRVIAYWKSVVQPDIRFTVPEPKFNDFLRSVIAHMHISATKDRTTGLYMVPAASYDYDVFANEACFQTLLLDTLADTKTAGQYLEAFLQLQGSRNFPGLHTGPPDAIFHGVKVNDVYDYTAHNYGLDHGTVLWTLAEHYLYSRDRQWFEHAWPHMKKAVDWIVQQRSATQTTGADGEPVRQYGLLPASQLEDNTDWANWFAINAYAWAGIDRTAQALKDLHYPEAESVARQADTYKQDLRNAVLRAAGSSPVARMRDGVYEPYVPVEPFRRLRLFGPARTAYYTRYGQPEIRPLYRLSADREGLYGPMILLNLGVFGPKEPIADWVLDDWEDNQTLTSGMGLNVHGLTDERLWFSQGGMVFQANLQNPILVYLKRHEIPAAIRGIYNNFVACLYRDVNAFTEEYHQWKHASGPFYKISDEARFTNRLRDMLALEDGDTLWLAGGTPRRWLESKAGIRVEGVMTYFGPVSYTMRAGSEAGVIEAYVQLPARNPARTAWLVVRTPGSHMRSVAINGRPWDKIDAANEAIELPSNEGPLRIQIRY